MCFTRPSDDTVHNARFPRFTDLRHIRREQPGHQSSEWSRSTSAAARPSDPHFLTEGCPPSPSFGGDRCGDSCLSQEAGTVLATLARAGETALAAAGEPLVEDGIVYKMANSPGERASAFRLVHDAYVDAGLMHPNTFQMRVMPHHLLPTTALFTALHGERVVATMTLVGDGRLGLPMEGVYDQEVRQMRQSSRWLGEVSALASAPARGGMQVAVGLMRLMAQFSRHNGLDHLLVAVHPRHARFYQRCLGFKSLGGEKSYPTVRNRPAVALHLDLSWSEDNPPADHRNYKLFFGESIAAEHLRFCPISVAERRYFAPALAYEANLTDVTPGAVLACA